MLDLETPFQRTTNRKWHIGRQMVTWPMTSRDPQRCCGAVRSAILATAWLLVLLGSRSSARHNFYTYRAARMSNDLLADSSNFSTLNSFKCSLTSSFLASHSAVYFFIDFVANYRFYVRGFGPLSFIVYTFVLTICHSLDLSRQT